MLVMWILCLLCRSVKRYANYAPSRNSMLFMLPRWNYARFYASIIGRSLVCVCVCAHHFQQNGHKPGMVANPACGQLKWKNGIFPVPVRP